MTPTPEQERVREGAGYTPGPWLWGIDDIDAIWAVNAPNDGGNIICEPPSVGPASQDRWPENARLIAAAPDLLAVLEEMFCDGPVRVAFAGNPIACDALEQRARTAIRKARGE